MQQLPQIFHDHLLKFFSKVELQKGIRNLDRSQFQCSFHKGQFPKSFLATGLQLGHPILNLKVQKRVDSDELITNCSCIKGKKDILCEHVVSFLLFYLINHTDLTQIHEEEANLDPNIAKPKYFGKIVKSGNKLVNSNYKHFNQIKYELTDGKVIDYPKAQELTKGRFQFHFSKPVEIKNQAQPVSAIQIVYKDEKVYDKVSVFESKSLFNWETGELKSIDPSLAKIFKFIEESNHFVPIWSILTQLKNHPELENIDFFIEDELIDLSQHHSPKHHISIEDFAQYTLKIYSYFTLENNLILPIFLRYLSYQQGILSSFKSKIELKQFLNYFFAHDQEYKKHLLTLKFNEKHEAFFEILESSKDLYDYDFNENKLLKFDLEHLFSVLELVLQNLDEQTYFSAQYSESTSQMSFNYIKGKSQDVLVKFLKSLKDKDIILTYQNKKVKKWASGINFKRNKASTNWFDIDINLSEDDYFLLKNYDPNSNTLEKDDQIILLDEAESKYLKFVKKYLDESEKDKNDPLKFNIKFNKCRLFDIYHLYNYSGDDLLTEEEVEICQKLLNIENLPKFPYPTNINGTPREYQETGFQWISLLYDLKLGACLADDMGLGKTFQTISFLQSIIHKCKRVLIVCPVSILANWVSEFEKFSDIKPTLFYGKDRSFTKDDKVIITSYGLLRKEADEMLSKYEWDVFIMDEVQKLKNYKSLGSQASRRINANFRLCLTGTPVENDLSEFYNILDLSVPGVWGEASAFQSFKRSKDARFIAKEIAKPFILRRTKSQVLHDLPDKIEQTIYLNFSQDEKEQYDKKLKEIRQELIDNKEEKKYIKVLQNILNLRQLCLWQAGDKILSSKVDFLMTNLEQILPDAQVLVYSQFTRYLDVIEKRLDEKKWNYSRLDGSYTLKKREVEIQKFKEGKNEIFLISLKAGGLGLNLTEASYIFLMDPWWNPAVESQAVDRAHRIGQEAVLTVYRPIIKNSVEEKVLALQAKKKELFDDLLDNKSTGEFSGKITLDDFQMLLSE